MEEYALRLNHCICGHNFKIQGDLTYIPNEAEFASSAYSTLVTTQEVIARVKVQVKFWDTTIRRLCGLFRMKCGGVFHR